MAEPKRALETPPTHDPITITNGASGWGPTPVSSSVQPNGTVQFTCAQSCWIWTMVNNALTNAFNGEQNNHVVCQPGPNNNFTPSVADGTTITIIPLAVNSNPPSLIEANVRGTIRISSTMGDGDKQEHKDRQTEDK